MLYGKKKAADEGLLQPLSRRALQHRISLYANDVVFFLRPAAADMDITFDILHLFGNASGLVMNIQKSSMLPIQCNEETEKPSRHTSLARCLIFLALTLVYHSPYKN